MPDYVQPLKLAIRSDAKAGLVRAYFSTTDDTKRLEVATISKQLLDDTPGLFDRWKETLKFAVVAFAEKICGAPVAFTQEVKLSEKN